MPDPKRRSFPLPMGANLVDIAKAGGAKPMSAEEVRKRLQTHDSLRVQVGPSATKGMSLDHDFDDARMDLNSMEVLFYDANPRSTTNAQFEDIKESIRHNGIINPLLVTRRPGTKAYMLCNGGNTRLRAIQELWHETGDPKFEKVSCNYRAWKSESHVLAGHLIENEVRGDMTLWDKAKGLIALKEKIETEEEALLSVRQMEDRLKQMGLPTTKSSISLFSFIVDKLAPIGPKLTFPAARSLQAAFAASKKLAAKLGLLEEDYWKLVQDSLTAVSAGLSSDLDALACVRAVEEAVATKVGRPLTVYQSLLAAQERAPQATLPELEEVVATKPAEPIQPAPNAMPAGIPEAALAPAARAGSVVATATFTETVTPQPDEARSPGVEPVAVQQATGAAVAQPSTGVQKPATQPEEAEARLALKRKAVTVAAEKLARDGGVMICFRHTSVMPLGFYMEFPAESIELSPSADSPHTTRPTVWWFLASLSGQRDHDTIKACLPESSAWRRAYEAKPPLDMAEQEIQINLLLGPSSDYLDMRWAFSPLNPVCRQMAELMLAHFELIQMTGASVAQSAGGDK